ncbi:MAG: DUF3467 domain-containing protein [Solirubrobacterales bacterium]
MTDASHNPTIRVPPNLESGVWANFVQISFSRHEFTLDFVRLETSPDPPDAGVVVARVAMSPLAVDEMRDELATMWAEYAHRALPKEARNDDR